MDLNKLLSSIKNPVTQKTLQEEGRWEIQEIQGQEFLLQYKRDGISPAEKRIIEKDILAALGPEVDPAKVIVRTTSSASQDVLNAPPAPKVKEEEKPAQIKTGHGTIGNKRSVPGVGKLIAVASGKGGVGKSTFTANLALSLKRQGRKVGIIDADIYGPSLPMILGKRKDKPMSNSEKKIIPVEAYGIKFMSFGFFINEDDPVIWRGPMLGGVLNQFLFDVDWDGLDYLIIDLPPGTGDIQLSMVQNANVDGAIIISTPQDIALLDARKGFEMFKKLNLPIIGMVENMSSFICSDCGSEHHIFGSGGVARSAQETEVDLIGQIPLEIELRQASDEGRPYMSRDDFSERPVFKAFEATAKKVDAFFTPNPQPEKSGLFSKILNLGK
jgi:ATP-binding protein involved in chromosome partitioning